MWVSLRRSRLHLDLFLDDELTLLGNDKAAAVDPRFRTAHSPFLKPTASTLPRGHVEAVLVRCSEVVSTSPSFPHSGFVSVLLFHLDLF
jgi:hypothetical protein